MRHLRGVLLALCVIGGAAAQADNADRALPALQSARCQTALPGDAATGVGGTRPARTSDGARLRPSTAGGSGSHSLGSMVGLQLGPVLLWVGVGVAVVLLLAALVRSLLARRIEVAAAAPKRVRGASGEAPAVLAPELPDYERLAAAGDFAAAVHAMLGHAIAMWSRGGGEAPLHATARELLRRAQRSAVATEPLGRLVHATELVHFGGRAADRSLFETSRDHLQHWEVACRPPK